MRVDVLFCLALFAAQDSPPALAPAVPAAVLKKYDELAARYSRSLGATLELCSRGQSNIFRVSGSGGYSGVDFYFDAEGRSLGKFSWKDVRIGRRPLPPVDMREFECTRLRSSREMSPSEGHRPKQCD